jgi:hypothetical protein
VRPDVGIASDALGDRLARVRPGLSLQRFLRGADMAERGPGVGRAAGDLLVAKMASRCAAVLRCLLQILGRRVVEARRFFETLAHTHAAINFNREPDPI